MNQISQTIGLSGVAGVLPSNQQDLHQLNADRLLSSSPETLQTLGFQRAHVCEPESPIEQMALEAAQLALNDAGLRPRDIDVLIWASARPENHLLPNHAAAASEPGCDPMDGFRYASAWLQDALDLHNADVLAVAQQGCSTMFSALRIARSLLLAEPQRQHALCVGVDKLPRGVPREILYNVISDAASAVVVSRSCERDVWVGYSQISRGYYWDPSQSQSQILAAYFPTAAVVLRQLLAQHSLRADEIDVVVPTGVSRASWDILLRLVGIPEERLFADVPSFGHTMTSDSFVYLQELRRRGALPRGSKLLLFTFGFGCSWCGLLLEH
jgi:3-oxoacyl-[acyl-carrier-protein] synthase-3